MRNLLPNFLFIFGGVAVAFILANTGCFNLNIQNLPPANREIALDCGSIILRPGKESEWVVEKNFSISNPTQVPWRIESISKSCGCTAIEFESNEIPARGEVKGKIAMFLRYRRESRNETAIVSITDGQNQSSRATISIRCETFPSVFFTNFDSATRITYNLPKNRPLKMEAVAYSKSPLMEKEFTLKINGDRLFLDPASPTERKSLGTINRTKALFDIPLEKYNHLPSIEIQVHFDNEFFTLTLLSSPKDAQKNSIVLSRKYRQQTVFLAEFDDVKLVSYDRKLLSIETESNPCQLDISLVNEPANATVSEILFEAQGKPQKLKVFISAD